MTGRAAGAGLPLAAACLAILAVAAAGIDQRSALPPVVSAHAYGFFLDRYPLFAAAIVYGLAHLVAAATAPGPAGILRRAAGLAIGAVLVLGLGLYPTFGGLVLRAGFGTGSMAFLNQQPMIAAYALGSAAAAFVFGIALGLGPLVMGTTRPGTGLLRRVAFAIASFIALWFALAVIGQAGEAGLGPWPRRPLSAREALVAAGLVLAAFLPHALLSGATRHARTPPIRHNAALPA